MQWITRRKCPPANCSGGFTLIELMVVVAIIGIIASIALPSYREYVIKSRRDAGKACLMQAVQQAERLYTTNLSYAALPANFPCEPSTATYYIVQRSAVTAKTFSLQAVPTAAQSDSKCGTLTITSAGAKTPTTAGCW